MQRRCLTKVPNSEPRRKRIDDFRVLRWRLLVQDWEMILEDVELNYKSVKSKGIHDIIDVLIRELGRDEFLQIVANQLIQDT